MTIVVKLGYGERFLNWYAHNTKLYIRGQQGKDWARQRELDAELAAAVGPWVQKQVDEATGGMRAELEDLRSAVRCCHECASRAVTKGDTNDT